MEPGATDTCLPMSSSTPSPGGSGRRRGHRTEADISPSTPGRKNKRKMSEPRKLTDFSVKKLCRSRSASPAEEGSGDMDQGLTDEAGGVGLGPPSPNSDTGPRGMDSRPVHPAFAVPGFAVPVGVPMLPGYGLPPGYPSYPGGVTLPSPGMTGMGHSPTNSTTSSEGRKSSNKSGQVPNSAVMSGGNRKRKNYKNMTRERRIEANARERSRVHLISAAFENLRRAVPSYSYNQRLSKLAILRIACSYILSLARLADQDYSQDSSNLSFSECVDLCTRTIQTEGRARRRH